MDSRQIYKVIGLMSGTSLDGLDIAYCVFKKKDAGWSFSIEKADTIKYSAAWTKKLSQAHLLSGQALLELDSEYGQFLGTACSAFSEKHKIKADFIASHGHTIFHQPKKAFTFQLGNGNTLHSNSGLPVVCDFRSLDVAKDGEGAPLVPVGDKFLFSEYEVCLNLGGIANLSMDVKGRRQAFDICFVNMGLNYLASKKGKAYDKDGDLAYAGQVNAGMLSALNKVYDKLRKERPSLGREIFEQQIKPILDRERISVEDRLRTFVESSAIELAKAFPVSKEKVNVLCTGGGTLNACLVSTLLDHVNDTIALVVPDDAVIKFKEALIFAFLGVLKVRGEANCLKRVTKATSDSCGGIMIGFKNKVTSCYKMRSTRSAVRYDVEKNSRKISYRHESAMCFNTYYRFLQLVNVAEQQGNK